MHQDRPKSKVFFYTTSPLNCPYIEGFIERRMVTELTGADANSLHNALSKGGFRRSHFMAYSPVCPDCNACVPVRIPSEELEYGKSWKRLISRFKKLEVEECDPVTNQEQFSLFEEYQKSRHGDGDMASMDYFDYRSMVEETPVETYLVEFRDEGRLVACLLMDKLDDGLSAVYSFYNNDKQYQGLGNYMVLWSVKRSLELGLPYVYLGYLINDCRKMSYKARFRPLEGCSDGLWTKIDQPK